MLADVPTREVFNITTGSAEVLPEVQLVTVSYDDVDEVQTITTSQVCACCCTIASLHMSAVVMTRAISDTVPKCERPETFVSD